MSKKWAIYQKEYGKDARQYIDNLEELSKTHLNGIVKQDYLPIILNRGLGYTSFKEEYEIKSGFINIVESEDFPLTIEEMFPKNNENFYFGWIDPEGNTYTCSFESHDYFANFMCKALGYGTYSCIRELENRGWISISRETPYTPYNKKSRAPYNSKHTITKAQYDKLCKLGFSKDWRVKMWFEESETNW